MSKIFKGIHSRRMVGAAETVLVGDPGLVPGDRLRAETLRVESARSLHYPEQPVLGVVLPGGAGELAWEDQLHALPPWSWFYLPRDYQAQLRSTQQNPVSVVVTMPAQVDEARWGASAEGEPITVKLEQLRAVVKEGRICYNAAGDGFPIDKPYFMGSYCVYDLKYGEMPQHVHEEQEEFMVILRAKGTHSGFLIGDHSQDLEDWTMIHVFPGFWHGFAPAEDGFITIIALYLDPVPGGCIDALPMTADDLAYWAETCEGLADISELN